RVDTQGLAEHADSIAAFSLVYLHQGQIIRPAQGSGVEQAGSAIEDFRLRRKIVGVQDHPKLPVRFSVLRMRPHFVISLLDRGAKGRKHLVKSQLGKLGQALSLFSRSRPTEPDPGGKRCEKCRQYASL